MVVWSRSEWQPRAEAHRRRAEGVLADVVVRRQRGLKHPVDDFLFHYYNLRPSQLTAWHPGVAVALGDAVEYADRPFYRVDAEGVASVDVASLWERRAETIGTAHRLLTAVAGRQARFGCFGMHEWAMVHGLRQDQTRHPHLPLRFAPDEVARIVESVGPTCSHFDAFRFFTPSARQLNRLQPTREQQVELDQPGCLHVNMDLYKYQNS